MRDTVDESANKAFIEFNYFFDKTFRTPLLSNINDKIFSHSVTQMQSLRIERFPTMSQFNLIVLRHVGH